MSPTPKQNLQFQITFTETNLRWLAGNEDTAENRIKIEKTKRLIGKLKDKLKEMEARHAHH